jgi:hypothetical protein
MRVNPAERGTLKLLIRGCFDANCPVLTDPEHGDSQPSQRRPDRSDDRTMAAAIGQGNGCLRFTLGDDRESLERRLTDVDLHLRLVERLAKPRRVNLGIALAFGLHFQTNPCPRCDYISAALIGIALDTIFKPSAAWCSQSRLVTASSVSTVDSRSAATAQSHS